MSRYGGTTIEAFAKNIEKDVPDGPRDWSVDIAYHLAMASIYLAKLQEQDVQTTYKRRRLIKPALEDAWRQLIFIRQRYVPETLSLNDIYRNVTLSGTGKVMVNVEEASDNGRRREGGSGDSSKTKQRRYRRKNPLRYRRRKFTERSSE